MTPAALQSLRDAISQRVGLQVSEEALPSLMRVVEQRLAATGCSLSEYLARIDEADEAMRICKLLVVGETSFFRIPAHFEALSEILAEWKRQGRPAPAILSAGCSTGEEAYSLAIVLARTYPVHPQIVGMDLDADLLARARNATYRPRALRSVDPLTRRVHFKRVQDSFVLSDSIRGKVRFEQRNLARLEAHAGTYDVIFCRNTMMYFAEDAARELQGKLAAMLAPDGLLFVAPVERVRSDLFVVKRVGDAFVYAHRQASREPTAPIEIADVSSKVAEPETRPSDTCVDRMKLITMLLRQEKRLDALVMLEGIRSRSHDEELIRAGLLVLRGDYGRALQAALVLRSGHRGGSAHYVLALMAEARNDSFTALREAERAVRCEPDFAMAQLHLGNLLAHDDPRRAREAFERAAELLPGEDEARLLTFGGGFSRQTLIAVCRAQFQESS